MTEGEYKPIIISMNRIEGQNSGVKNTNMRERQGNKLSLEKVVDDGVGENPKTLVDRILSKTGIRTGISIGVVAVAAYSGLAPGMARAEAAIVVEGEMPSQKGGVVEQLENALANQETDGWPVVEGLNYKEGKYYYQKDNVYGGKEGEMAGLVKPEVYVEGEKIGGVCFKPEVCKVFLERALTGTPKGELNLKSIPPVDISDYDGEVKISDGTVTASNGGVFGAVYIECLSDLIIVNTHIGSFEYVSGPLKLKMGKGSAVMERLVVDYRRGEVSFHNSSAYRYELMGFIGEKTPDDRTRYVDFGEAIVKKDEESMFFLSYSDLNFEKKVSDFMLVGDKMVFMISNEPDIEELEYKPLSAGYKGEEVVAFKERMVELGYFKNISSVNDTFTASTAEYFKEFQEVNGLPITGVADSETLKLFYSDEAIPKP